jgi:branched-chain amino acid transport system substrate-binding protein
VRFFLAITLLLIAFGPRTPAAQTAADVTPFLYTVVKVFDPLAWLHGADRFPGASTADQNSSDLKIGVFGPHADEVIRSPETARLLRSLKTAGKSFSLVPIVSEAAWGKASSDLVNAVYQHHVLALIALDRASSHLAEQIAVKSFVPVLAISSDRALTSTNIPWIFRLPQGTSLEDAVNCLSAAITLAGSNRSGIRDVLASGMALAGLRFESTGEIKE